MDNGSEDNSVSFVREHYPWVKLLLLDENTGFAKGNNRGLDMRFWQLYRHTEQRHPG